MDRVGFLCQTAPKINYEPTARHINRIGGTIFSDSVDLYFNSYHNQVYMTPETKNIIITAFISHLDLIASMPGRNVKNNIEEATQELIGVCQKLNIDEKQVYLHYKKLSASLTA